MFSYLQPIFNKTLINVWGLLKFMIPIIICVKFAEELNILTKKIRDATRKTRMKVCQLLFIIQLIDQVLKFL